MQWPNIEHQVFIVQAPFLNSADDSFLGYKGISFSKYYLELILGTEDYWNKTINQIIVLEN